MASDFSQKSDDLICKVLRREQPAWPFRTGAADFFLHRAREQGVGPLVATLAKDLDWPDDIKRLLHSALIVQAKWELRHRSLIATVIDELSAAGIGAILLKGTALAYTLYPDPLMRRRGDTDILISQSDKATARRILGRLGFDPAISLDTKLVSYQSSFVTDHDRHWIDLHWKIVDSDFVASKMRFRQLSEHLVNVPPLSPNAYALDSVYSLLFACIHRAKHLRRSDDRLIWSYDIHLMLDGMSTSVCETVANTAREKGMMGLLRSVVVSVKERFGGSLPAALRLEQEVSNEGVTAYYEGDSKRRTMADFWAAGAAEKLSMLYPRKSYLERRFGRKIHGMLLPWFAIRRLLDRRRPGF